MKSWTEFHIAIVYYTGLLIALLTSILAVLYLQPIKLTIKKITEKFDALWNSSFKTTIILAGLLGAMSVTFRDCDGNYDYLLNSKHETIKKGLEQVSSSFDYLATILSVWLIIFLILRLTVKKNKMFGTQKVQ